MRLCDSQYHYRTLALSDGIQRLKGFNHEGLEKPYFSIFFDFCNISVCRMYALSDFLGQIKTAYFT